MNFIQDSVFNQKFDYEDDLISIKNYFNDYAKLITSFELCEDENCNISEDSPGCGSETCKTDALYRDFLGINQEQLIELKAKTSIKNLKRDDEIDLPKATDNTSMQLDLPEDVEAADEEVETEDVDSPLISVNKRLEMTKVTKTNFPRTFFKYCNYEWCIKEKGLKSKLDFDILKFPTIVACVKVYHPFMSLRNQPIKIKLLQEIHILGDQTLSQLKDKIVCSLDYIGDKDLSNEWFLKDVGYNVTAKDETPSSFIFIENTFFNDTRSPKLKNSSKELREWASGKNLGDFQTAKMEDAKISDLNVKIGRPYVYQHLGNCEHIIMFSDIRLLDTSDPIRFSCFPRVHCTGRLYGKHCMMCADFYARWVVVGNERLTHDKAFMCNKCFISYNYINGQKIGKFEAYKYVDPVAIL